MVYCGDLGKGNAMNAERIARRNLAQSLSLKVAVSRAFGDGLSLQGQPEPVRESEEARRERVRRECEAISGR